MAQKAGVELFHALRSAIKPIGLELPPLFKSAFLTPYLQNLVLAFGRLGVQNGISEWDSLFQMTPRFSLTLLPLEIGSERLTIAHVRFASEGECKEFCRLAGFPDVGLQLPRSSESGAIARIVRRLKIDEVYYCESTNSFPARASFFDLLSK